MVKEEKNIIDIHCFICERCSFETPLGPSRPDVAKEFRKSVKDKVKALSDDPKIRVNGSGCLGQCNEGISCVIYPGGDWTTNLRPGNEDLIVEKILAKTSK